MKKKRLRKPDEALKLQSELANMSHPSRSDVQHLQAYMETREMGPLTLQGPDADIWGSSSGECHIAPVPDLVALQGRHNEDPFSKWITSTGMKMFFWFGCGRWRKASGRSGLVGYPEATLLRITRWISSIVASLLPVMSIAILYCVSSMLARLAIIAAFNFSVAIFLLGFTKAKTGEVFAVAAA
jgi:hypothetical protein